MQNDKHPMVPAKLPAHSRAAAAQKLDERPLNPVRGAYYPVPHLNQNPSGWRTKRHVKRKNLHRSNEQYLATDRVGTQWGVLPIAIVILAVIVVLATVLVVITAAVGATQTRFQQQVTTLPDILPQDSLKMYDKAGTIILQIVVSDLQTIVPMWTILTT